MGRRGPPSQPTALKLLKGETRSSRLNKREPKPTPVLPKMPRGLDERAAQVWRRVIRDYGRTGVLTAVDGDALRAYCEAVSRYEYAAQQLAQSGPLIRGARRGELVKNPLHQVVRDNADLMRQFARELGLTPAARTGIKVPEAPSDDDALGAWEHTG